MNQDRKMRDLIQIARQDVLVDEGETVRVVLSYRSLEGEAIEYEKRLLALQVWNRSDELDLDCLYNDAKVVSKIGPVFWRLVRFLGQKLTMGIPKIISH